MTTSPVQPSLLKTVWPIVVIYGLWLLASLASLALGEILPLQGSATSLPGVLFALLFTLLIASSGALFSLHLGPHLLTRPTLHRRLTSATLLLGIGLFLLGRHVAPGAILLGILGSANLVVFALLVGSYISHAVNKPSELIPVCVVMSAADLFSVRLGPSKQIVADINSFYQGGRVGPAPWSDLLLVKITVPGVDYLMPVFGVADVIVLVFLIAAAKKFGLQDNLIGPSLDKIAPHKYFAPYLPAAALGLGIAVLAAQLFNLFLPALPVIALVFLAVTMPRNPVMRGMQQTEWLAVIIGSAVILGMFAARPGLF